MKEIQKSLGKPSEILSNISGYKVYYYRTAPSTNDIAKKIARQTPEDRFVIFSETQSCGRGRRGRHWISPKGGLWFSIVMRPHMDPKDVLKLTFIASLAVAKTIKALFSVTTEVKWPNDVLVNHKKVCGILTEASVRKDSVSLAVIGVGVNANIDLQAFPTHLQESATSLRHELGCEVDRMALMERILQDFLRYYSKLRKGLWKQLLNEWKGKASFFGKDIKITGSGGIVEGKALDINEDGALIIEANDGTTKEIVTGDLVVTSRS
ncbi:MAG: biotin--[acetyl-CoA-carboxylase] ligase [Candidatus Bathyarchaeota archaeon]|nr:MAG: biotin--[acetyl-CoA-carboxylase] ligase [Candidatus Bathyarchaeota archaeon]